MGNATSLLCCLAVGGQTRNASPYSGRVRPRSLRRARTRGCEGTSDAFIRIRRTNTFIRVPYFFLVNIVFFLPMASSSSKKTEKRVSPLAALAPLHALTQLIPATPTGKEGRDFDFILLTSLKNDAWFVHVGHPDGRWWNGAWHAADVESLAVR